MEDEHEYTCETCDKGFDHEDDGYVTEAGFECFACNNASWEAARRAYLASDEYRIRRNYPDLDRHVRMQEADPVGFYYACKNGTIE